MSLDPMRVRRPSRGFGWIDHRVLSGGHLSRLDCTQIATYCTLCLVADRHGISFYRPESLAKILKRPRDAVAAALDVLAAAGLIAHEGRYVQVRDVDEIEKAAASELRPARELAPAPAAVATSVEPPDVTLARLDPAEREKLFDRARARFQRFLAHRAPSAGALAAAAVGLLREEETACRKRS
jgi:hypothetical protein